MNARHNRAVLAARAGVRRNPGTPATDVAARVLAPSTGTGPVRRSSAVRMTAAQRDSEGNRSAWAASPYYFTDPKWDQTVTSQHVGTGGFR